MHFAVAAVTAAVTPSPTPTLDPDLVTPGPWGFGIIVFLAIAVMLLVWDMLRRIRRARYRLDVDEMLDAEDKNTKAGGAEADGADINADSATPPTAKASDGDETSGNPPRE